MGWTGLVCYEHGNEFPGSIKCWEFLSSCTIGASQEGLSATSLKILVIIICILMIIMINTDMDPY
jgi:hypothetical protein